MIGRIFPVPISQRNVYPAVASSIIGVGVAYAKSIAFSSQIKPVFSSSPRFALFHIASNTTTSSTPKIAANDFVVTIAGEAVFPP